VLAWTASTGLVVLLRVIQIRADRTGSHPILERLAWDGRHVPHADVLAELPRVPPPQTEAVGRPVAGPIYGPFKIKRRDPDWSDAGLKRCASVPPRPGDEEDFTTQTSFLQWAGLPTHLELAVTGLYVPPEGAGGQPHDKPTVP
jgi:hypothetical protein